jgi:hypothetical protein
MYSAYVYRSPKQVRKGIPSADVLYQGCGIRYTGKEANDIRIPLIKTHEKKHWVCGHVTFHMEFHVNKSHVVCIYV